MLTKLGIRYTIRAMAPEHDFSDYYKAIVNHPQTKNYYLLQGKDAIGFIMGMGEIKLEGAPFKSGQELLDFVLNNKHIGSPQILIPHQNIVMLFMLENGKNPTVFLSTNPANLKPVFKKVGKAIGQQTLDTLDAIIAAGPDKG